MSSLDLNGSKIHAIYLVDFLDDFEKMMAWWHDAMHMMQRTQTKHPTTLENMEGIWSSGLGASQHSTTTRGSRPEI